MVLLTDEAQFSLSRNINTKNSIYWAEKTSHDVALMPINEAKMTV